MDNTPNPSDNEQTRAKERLLETLKELPIIEVACKKAGVGRATYYRWRQEDTQFKRRAMDALEQGIEFVNDMSEAQVIQLIKDKKMPAIILWLKHHHPRYGSKGWSHVAISSDEELTAEEQGLLTEALALASGKRIRHHD